MKKTYPVLILIIFFFFACKKEEKKELEIFGWNILTDNTPTALRTLEATKNYQVNQIQLSQEICHELRDIKNQWNRNIVNNLTKKAHEEGIDEVLVWDHALYYLKYYPSRYKIDGKINLDNPDFWEWLIHDYEKMLDEIPEVDGIVLTLNDSETNVVDQYSEFLNTPRQRLAAFVDSLANFIVEKRKLSLYIRYPVYSQEDVDELLSFLKIIKNREIKFQVQGIPDDYLIRPHFYKWVENIPIPVVIDFDCAHVNEGQGNVASIFPEVHLETWKYYQKMDNVVGFSLRTDRLGKTTILDSPSEINLFAVYEGVRNPEIETDSVIQNYLYKNYDSLAVPYLFDAFKLAPDVILSSFYTLGINTTDHSQIDFKYKESFYNQALLQEPENDEIEIKHGIGKTFHYWSEIVNHLAPSEIKNPEDKNLSSIFENNWLQPEELMDSSYLDFIMTEKNFAKHRAYDAISKIKMAKPYCSNPEAFNLVYHTFSRTQLAAQLRKAYAQVYYGQRIWNRGEEFQNEHLRTLIQEGISEIEDISKNMKNYRRKGPVGQYDWEEDADIAMNLVQQIRSSDLLAQVE